MSCKCQTPGKYDRRLIRTLLKWSFNEAIRPRGFCPDAMEAIVRLLFKECREVPFVMVSISPEDF